MQKRTIVYVHALDDTNESGSPLGWVSWRENVGSCWVWEDASGVTGSGFATMHEALSALCQRVGLPAD